VTTITNIVFINTVLSLWSVRTGKLHCSASLSSGTFVDMAACVCAAGITRLPVLEGEISHIEIPRVATNLGITIVGGADTALVSSTTIFWLFGRVGETRKEAAIRIPPLLEFVSLKSI
jgi:hypothetical protein